jgi:hypothetical protein
MLAAAATCGASEFRHPSGKIHIIIDPPPRYADQRFGGTLDVRFLPPKELSKVCTISAGRSEDVACAAVVYDHYCLIRMSEELDADARKKVFRHEYAHCLGWDAGHSTR